MNNLNLLSIVNFSLKVVKAPTVNFLVQQVNMPGLVLGQAPRATPFVMLSEPGKLQYDEFRVTYKVDESLESYMEIFNWMVALGTPDAFTQYDNSRSDISLIVLNSSNRPIMNIHMTEAYPTSLSGLNLDATLQQIDYVTVDVSFKFDRFYYNPI